MDSRRQTPSRRYSNWQLQAFRSSGGSCNTVGGEACCTPTSGCCSPTLPNRRPDTSPPASSEGSLLQPLCFEAVDCSKMHCCKKHFRTLGVPQWSTMALKAQAWNLSLCR